MSEIEKASEEQDTFRLRELAADARAIAAREKASKWHAKMEKAAEDRIREIAREEIEAAGAGAWVCGACGAVPSPTCPHRGVAPQCGVLVRASDFAIPGDPFNQEGGDANSPGRHERPATGLDKSPPAVEAPAAGGYERSPAEKTVLKRLAKNGRSADNNFAGIPTGSDLHLCEMLMAEIDAQRCVRTDMTALARRLAEALNQVLLHDAYKVPFETYAQIEIALAEARKHKLIE